MSRKKGKSQRKQRDYTASSGPGFKEAQGDMDAPNIVRQKETARVARLPSWRLESSLESFADLPRCEGMVVGLFPAGAIVRITDRDLICGLAGTFRPPEGSSALAVGDQVIVAITKSQHGEVGSSDKLRTDGKIVERQLRRSLLARPQPRSGKRRDAYKEESFLKVIAANMDQLVIVSSICQPTMKPALIERFMIIAERGDLTPLLVVNKSDLAVPDAGVLADILAMGLEPLLVSAVSGAGLDELRGRLTGKRSILAGASGVGKSSLINAIVPSAEAATGAIRVKDQRGRHTTASASVYYLEGPSQDKVRVVAESSSVSGAGEDEGCKDDEAGDAVASSMQADAAGRCRSKHETEKIFGNHSGMLIDTPGVRELGMRMDASELPWYFPEFEVFSVGCKFNDCTHTHEPHCAVIAAVEAGTIAPQRFASYLRLIETLEEQR